MIACGGGGGGTKQGASTAPPPPPSVFSAPSVDIEVGLKQLTFSWIEVSGASHYKLLENPDGHSGFTQVGADIPAGTSSVKLAIAVHLQDFTNALYIVEACNATTCLSSTAVHAMNGMLNAIGYFKASNTEAGDQFGFSTALSADGTTLAVGAPREDSNSTVVGGNQNNNLAHDSGAVYVFRFNGTNWFQQAHVKASNTENPAPGFSGDIFGEAVALSADGNTLAVGARDEDSRAVGINGDQSDDSAIDSGAVYVFQFDGTNWSQEAYVKASNTAAGDTFGEAIALSADGNTLAVGALREDSNATGINGNQSDNSANWSGAVYVFQFDGTNWSQEAYIKASNAEGGDMFGHSVALSADGAALAVGAIGERSNAIGINGNQNDNSWGSPGAVYVFHFDGTGWSQQAYVKGPDSLPLVRFGTAVEMSADGATLAVGGYRVAYVFRYDGTDWSEPAIFSGTNLGFYGRFGFAMALSSDGKILAVGAEEANNYTSAESFGAVHVFRFDGTDWINQAYLNASNTEASDKFGEAIALSADGSTMAVGARSENSSAIGIDGDQSNNSAGAAGAVFLH